MNAKITDRFLRFTMFSNANMRQHFLLEYFFCISNSGFFGNAWLRTTGPDEIEGH